MTLSDILPVRQRLTFKIVGLLLTFLTVALTAIGLTLWLSWQLEGGAAAINDAGSLRMRAYRLVNLSVRHELNVADRPDILQDIATTTRDMDRIFGTLQRGDPARPLFVPKSEIIQRKLAEARDDWIVRLRPALPSSGHAADIPALRVAAEAFVQTIDNEVLLIEIENSRRTTLLRMSQLVLGGLGVAGTVCVIYLLFLIIIRPVNLLQEGISKMAGGDFGVRLDIESRDEFGVLTAGFNQMAARLEDLYDTLEKRVEQKTQSVEQKNRELACLYDMTTFLSQPSTVEVLCEGFVDRVVSMFGAQGGTVRATDPGNNSLHMVVHRGVSKQMADQEHCLKEGECLCGEAAKTGMSVVHDLRKAVQLPFSHNCREEGFKTVSVFQIHSSHGSPGVFNLYFIEPRRFDGQEMQLLDTLGHHLGTALDNRRLAAKERELAVSQERNLMAQGLHDSIAQGLTFLNLQAQLLDDSIKRHDWELAGDTMPLIRAGIQESYEDVRELLHNFRAKLGQESLPEAIRITLDKFQRQTGVITHFEERGRGAPLPPEHQLQLLFIVQEALSNIRKHAQARHVMVKLRDAQDLELTILDDGIGFDPEAVKAKGESHVGLSIMRERAQRVGAQLSLDTSLGEGVRWRLWLAREQRMVA